MAKTSFPPLPEGRIYVCVAPYCWGRDRDAATAIANAKKNRARVYEGAAGWRYILFDAPDTAYVDEFGAVRWTWATDAEPPAEAREVARYNMEGQK